MTHELATGAPGANDADGAADSDSRPARPLDDFDRGVKNRRAMLGDAWVDKSLDNANTFNAEFQDLITRYAWHEIWVGLASSRRRAACWSSA